MLALLIAPVTAIVAGLFLDDVAETVERDRLSRTTRRAARCRRWPALVLSLKFFGVVILGNLLALLLLLMPGVNIAAFFIVNGYLLGREFFEFAAMRFRPEAEAKALRRSYAGTVFLAGLVIAGFLAVPLLNLLTPLFAAAMMVHLHKMVSARDGRAGRPAPLSAVTRRAANSAWARAKGMRVAGEAETAAVEHFAAPPSRPCRRRRWSASIRARCGQRRPRPARRR